MQPTNDDVQQVAAYMGQPIAPAPQPVAQPAPAPEPFHQPQPVQSQPIEPAAPVAQPQQPAADPFATFNQQPQPQVQSQPGFQYQTPAPQQAVEVAQPQQQLQPQPETGAPAPAQQPQPAPTPTQQSYEEYVNSIMSTIPEPTPVPKLEDVDTNSLEDVENYFANLKKSIVEEVDISNRRKEAVIRVEQAGWEEAISQYPSLRSNKGLRETIQAIRIGKQNQNVFLSPLQAAQELLNTMGQNYQQGIVDNQVHTTIESVQPMGGGSQAVAPIANKDEENRAVEVGGEIALQQILANRINNGLL